MYSAVFFTEILFAILVQAIIIVIVWAFFSAYKKRGEEIRILRKKLEKLKRMESE